MIHENQAPNKLDIKKLSSEIVAEIKSRYKMFGLILTVLLSLSTIFFVRQFSNPTLKSSSILVSRDLTPTQLKSSIDFYKNYVKEPEFTPINPALKEYFKLLDFRDITIEEIKNKSLLPQKENEFFVYYNLNYFFKNNPKKISLNTFDSILINDIQRNCFNDKRIQTLRTRYQNGIKESDSLILIAKKAGESYASNIQHSSGNQLMVMNDLFVGINTLNTSKLDLQHSLEMLNPENLVFQTTSSIVTKKYEMPILVFFLAFAIWVFICGIWIAVSISMKD